jgi:maltooligosyltrehalose synthase
MFGCSDRHLPVAPRTWIAILEPAGVHRLIFRLMRQGLVTGLRLDHPDGLFDPEQYFLDLQAGCCQTRAEAAVNAPSAGGPDDPCYVVLPFF